MEYICEQKTIRLIGSLPNDIKLAADILQHEGIVALPTETVYGLAANGFCNKAIKKIFAAKKRPLNNPLILHVKNEEQAKDLFDFAYLSPLAYRRFKCLSKSFWPGPLTIVAKKASHVPYEVTGGLSCVAVRIPKNEITLAVMAFLDFPLAMPSANLATRPSPTRIEHVLKTLDGRIDAVVDGGHCNVGIESSVVKIDDEFIKILRPGVINKKMIEDSLKESVDSETSFNQDRPISPGQSYLHYSPSIAAVLLHTVEKAKEYWQSEDIILAKSCDIELLKKSQIKRPKNAITIILSSEPLQYAKELYNALYNCELSPTKRLIIISPTAANDDWHAIIDRLKRSAGLRSS